MHDTVQLRPRASLKSGGGRLGQSVPHVYKQIQSHASREPGNDHQSRRHLRLLSANPIINFFLKTSPGSSVPRYFRELCTDGVSAASDDLRMQSYGPV